MKRNFLLLIALTMAIVSNGQTLTIQTGTSVSRLDWQIGSLPLNVADQPLIGFSFLGGVDYWENKYFNLSTNLGFVQKGGKGFFNYVNEQGTQIVNQKLNARLDYLTVNTTFDLKYPIKDKVLPFISVGPRFDYLVSSSREFDIFKEIDAFNTINLGLNLGGGIKYDFPKIQIGLRADYFMNLYKVAEWKIQPGNLDGKLSDRTMAFNLIFGYKI